MLLCPLLLLLSLLSRLQLSKSILSPPAPEGGYPHFFVSWRGHVPRFLYTFPKV